LGGRKFIRPVKAEWWGAGHRCKKRSKNKNLKNVKKRKERDKNKRKRL